MADHLGVIYLPQGAWLHSADMGLSRRANQTRRLRTWRENPGPPDDDDALRTEGAVSRGWRDARSTALGFGFLVTEMLATGLVGAFVSALAALAAFFALLVLVIGTSIVFLAPRRQRDELRARLRAREGTDDWLRAACQSLSGRIDRLVDEREADRPTVAPGNFRAVNEMRVTTWNLETSTKCFRFNQDLRGILEAVQERGWIDHAEAERIFHDEATEPEGWRRVARQLDEWANRLAPSEVKI